MVVEGAVPANCLLLPYLLRLLCCVWREIVCGVCGEITTLAKEDAVRQIYQHKPAGPLRCVVCVVKKQGMVVGGALLMKCAVGFNKLPGTTSETD